MLEWVCPKCGRGVDPALTKCPFCGFQEEKPEAASPPAAPASAPAMTPAPAAAGKKAVRRVLVRRKSRFDWKAIFADVERGFRFGLGFVAALAVTYFVLYLIAHFGGHGEWAERLAQWLQLR